MCIRDSVWCYGGKSFYNSSSPYFFTQSYQEIVPWDVSSQLLGAYGTNDLRDDVYFSTDFVRGTYGRDVYKRQDKRLEEIIEFQLKVMNSRLNYPLIFHYLDREPGLIYEDRMMTVPAFPLKHLSLIHI